MSHEDLAAPPLDRPMAQADNSALVVVPPHSGQPGLSGRADREAARSSNRAPHDLHRYSKSGT